MAQFMALCQQIDGENEKENLMFIGPCIILIAE